MVHHTGVAADTVYNMLEDSQGSKFNEAGVHLRTAAGIFERLHKVMATVVQNKPSRLILILVRSARGNELATTTRDRLFVCSSSGSFLLDNLLSPSCGSL